MNPFSHARVVLTALFVGALVGLTLVIFTAGGPLAAALFYAAVLIVFGEYVRWQTLAAIEMAKAAAEPTDEELAELEELIERLVAELRRRDAQDG